MLRKTYMVAAACGALMAANVAVAGGASGQATAVTCWGCHGPSGSSNGATPSLKGLPASHIKSQMMAFKSGARPATIMNRIAKGYSDGEIAAMADYIGAIK